MHALCTHILYLCVFHRWMALRRERAALAHNPRNRASLAPTRDPKRMPERTRVPIYTPGVIIYVCIYIYCSRRVRWLIMAISRRTYPSMRTRCRRPHRRRAQSHGRVHSRGCCHMHAHAHLFHEYICTYIYVCMKHICLHVYIYICI
jgi:hypothetical protein